MKHDDAPSAQTPALGGPPKVARELFGPRLGLAEEYAALLATDGVVRGLIGPREVPRLWDRHLVNCALLAQAIVPDVSVCDVGSGAGLPGLVLAVARPDLRITLVEPLLRRTRFLDEAVDALGLDQVTVWRGRAEDYGERYSFDVVTSRAVAPLERLAAWSMPLVAPTGVMLALKGSGLQEEVDDAAPGLRRLGCGRPELLVLSAGAGGDAPDADGDAPDAGGDATDADAVGSVADTLGDEVIHRTHAVRLAWADPTRVGLPNSRKRRANRRHY